MTFCSLISASMYFMVISFDLVWLFSLILSIFAIILLIFLFALVVIFELICLFANFFSFFILFLFWPLGLDFFRFNFLILVHFLLLINSSFSYLLIRSFLFSIGLSLRRRSVGRLQWLCEQVVNAEIVLSFLSVLVVARKTRSNTLTHKSFIIKLLSFSLNYK